MPHRAQWVAPLDRERCDSSKTDAAIPANDVEIGRRSIIDLSVLTTVEEILARVREVTRSTIAPRAVVTDREGRWPEEGFRALQAAGLGGLVVPRAYGGLGQGLFTLARACEEIALGCPSTAISYGMHHVGAAVLAAKATPEQASRYLEPIAAGQHLTTLALSEPGSGSHFYLPQTRLSARDGGFIVNGKKSFVTNGGHADSYVVSTVSAAPDSPPGQFSCVILDKGLPGLRWGEPWHGLGMRGNSSVTLELSDVELPPSAVLGNPGDQVWFVFNVITPFFLIAMAGTYLGIAASALAEVREHLASRVHAHTGATLSQQALVQHRVGVLWAEVARTRALIHHAASLGDAADPDALPALCSAKAEVAECVVSVLNEGMTLLGGRGYAEDSCIHRLFRDARAAHVMAPTTEQLRTWTGRAFLRVPLLGD